MAKQKMIKCACYARVSTEEQGSSVINQHDYFDSYINKNKWKLYDIYTDEAISGTKIIKRLAFQKMIEDGKNKKYDVLLAKSFTRFGRNQRETLTAISELRAVGIRIIFTENNLDSQTDATKFGLFAWLAEQEAQTTSERLKLIWQHYDEKGKIHACTPPYGYDYSEEVKNFVINEKESEVIKRIFNLYMQGYGLSKIARTLTIEEVPTKKGGEWAGITIRGIITNPTYIGTLVQGKSRTIDVTMKERESINPEDWQIHPNHHQSIISEETFYKAQNLLNERATYSNNFTQRTKHSNTSLFSNLIRCAECGSSFTIKRQKHFKNYSPYYTCINYALKGKKISGHSRVAIYEDALITAIKNDFINMRNDDYQKIREFFNSVNIDEKPKQIEHALKSINQKIKEYTKLSITLLQCKNDGSIKPLQFQLQNEEIEDNLQELFKKKEEYEKITKESNVKHSKNIAEEVIEQMNQVINMDSKMWTNAMLKEIIDKITIDIDMNITIDFKYQNCKDRYICINDFGNIDKLLEWLDTLLPLAV